MKMLALVALWTLTFTVPRFDAKRATPCPLGCRDTAVSIAPLKDVAAAELWSYGQQSPLWRADSSALLADFRAGRSTTQNRDGAAIAAQATFHRIGLYPGPWLPSAKATLTLPDTLPLGRVYLVTFTDTAGNRACESNEVIR